MANENIEISLIPYYGYFNQLNHNNIADGGLCFTLDSNQEFFKLQNTLYPVVGQYKHYTVTMLSGTNTITQLIPNLSNAIIDVFATASGTDDIKKYTFEYSQTSSGLKIDSLSVVAAPITFDLYVQYQGSNN